jgi:hypothetical protein
MNYEPVFTPYKVFTSDEHPASGPFRFVSLTLNVEHRTLNGFLFLAERRTLHAERFSWNLESILRYIVGSARGGNHEKIDWCEDDDISRAGSCRWLI